MDLRVSTSIHFSKLQKQLLYLKRQIAQDNETSADFLIQQLPTSSLEVPPPETHAN
jgi:hypothetical protein